MSNLGSNNTPVKGQNFELPAGAKIDEDNGDAVIRDSNGNISLRYNEATSTWELESLSSNEEIAAQGLLHKTHIEANETLEILADYGSVIAGPLTFDGSIEIEDGGRLKFI